MSSSSKRVGRITSELQKTISKIIFNDLNIPELNYASISKVKISPDLSVATVYFSSLKKSKEDIEELEKLFRRNNKTIRMNISKYMSLRTTPTLRFFYDDTLDSVFRIEELLNTIKNDKDKNESDE
ncbi:MAG: 30S ribosome-binding factor RbfA [Candidatus Delongbacteria bacterium]|nr:30S ribosome-binding factor RbfA [Candidatus Delongbacteria bacterium]